MTAPTMKAIGILGGDGLGVVIKYEQSIKRSAAWTMRIQRF
jgi:hypothetical protein